MLFKITFVVALIFQICLIPQKGLCSGNFLHVDQFSKEIERLTDSIINIQEFAKRQSIPGQVNGPLGRLEDILGNNGGIFGILKPILNLFGTIGTGLVGAVGSHTGGAANPLGGIMNLLGGVLGGGGGGGGLGSHLGGQGPLGALLGGGGLGSLLRGFGSITGGGKGQKTSGSSPQMPDLMSMMSMLSAIKPASASPAKQNDLSGLMSLVGSIKPPASSGTTSPSGSKVSSPSASPGATSSPGGSSGSPDQLQGIINSVLKSGVLDSLLSGPNASGGKGGGSPAIPIDGIMNLVKNIDLNSLMPMLSGMLGSGKKRR